MTGVHTVWKSDVWGTWHAIWTYENESNQQQQHKTPWKSMAPANKHSSKHLLLCPRAKAHFYRLGLIWLNQSNGNTIIFWYHGNELLAYQPLYLHLHKASSKHHMELLWYSTASSCILSRKPYHDGIALKNMMVMMCSRYWPMTAVLLLLWSLLEDRDSMFVPLRDTGVSRELSVL